MGQWDAWIGREEIRRDRVDEAAVARWLATFDRRPPADGSVPQGYHWCLGLPDVPTASLGADGHPARGAGETGLMPPVPFPRRMWAASNVEFAAPLYPGRAIERRSRVESIEEKAGASGKLLFTSVTHEIRSDGAMAVRETQTIVFREAPAAAQAGPTPGGAARFDPAQWDVHRRVLPGETLLFRYSALTFNSHRIHYDRPYATGEEGYGGLVVHGPLTATLLLDLAARYFGDNRLSRFDFRALSPALCGEELSLALRGSPETVELSAFGPDGRRIMEATAAT